MDFENTITSLDELLAVHGEVSNVAQNKQRSGLDAHCREFIAASPMVLLSSANAAGWCDVTPRGDAPGFVRVLSDSMLAIPERSGNNRLDCARNILENPRVGLIFLIPGVLETLRVNGRARLVQDKTLLESFAVNAKTPKFAVVVHTEEVYLQCGKAFTRSGLWQTETWTAVKNLTSRGAMLADHTK
jgi:PPOX class probable FMN-dependent enzyme